MHTSINTKYVVLLRHNKRSLHSVVPTISCLNWSLIPWVKAVQHFSSFLMMFHDLYSYISMYPWFLFIILYLSLKYLPLGHILYLLRTFYLLTVAFYTSDLAITAIYFSIHEDVSPTQDSLNSCAPLFCLGRPLLSIYCSIISWNSHNFELKCPTSWSQTSTFQLLSHLISHYLKYHRFSKTFPALALDNLQFLWS